VSLDELPRPELGRPGHWCAIGLASGGKYGDAAVANSYINVKCGRVAPAADKRARHFAFRWLAPLDKILWRFPLGLRKNSVKEKKSPKANLARLANADHAASPWTFSRSHVRSSSRRGIGERAAGPIAFWHKAKKQLPALAPHLI